MKIKQVKLKRKRTFLMLFLSLGVCFSACSQDDSINYGNNEEVGSFVETNGVKTYFEMYGHGEPLVLVHGNGGSIKYMSNQIDYFSKKYQVIAIDSRGRGKSELGSDSLTYYNMAKDIAVLLDSLNLDSAYYIGRSDGAIISLMMGVYFPSKVKKIAAFGTNIRPDSTALYPFVIEYIHKKRLLSEEMLLKGDTTENWNLMNQKYRLMEFQPQMTKDDLQKIKAPVLVISCDRDLILEEHTLEIYKGIPKSNWCIFPGENHRITRNNPKLFNKTVDLYFDKPYSGKDIR